MDCNPLEFSIPGILQARILEWVVISFSNPQGYEGILTPLNLYTWASLVAQLVKKPPAMQETWVRSLGWEDPLEKEMATHSSTFAWKIPWMEETGML